MEENSRRRFLQSSFMSFIAVPLLRHTTWPIGSKVAVTLEGRAEKLGNETVSFGLPLPYGFQKYAENVRVVDERGVELHIAVRSLEPWRIGGREYSIRSLLIQFKADFSKQKTQRVTVSFDAREPPPRSDFVAVSQTLIDEQGLKGPRVAAVLPADWLCRSG